MDNGNDATVYIVFGWRGDGHGGDEPYVEEVFAHKEHADALTAAIGGEAEERRVKSEGVATTTVYRHSCEVTPGTSEYAWSEEQDAFLGEYLNCEVRAERKSQEVVRSERLRREPASVSVRNISSISSPEGRPRRKMLSPGPQAWVSVEGTDEQKVEATYREEVEKAQRRLLAEARPPSPTVTETERGTRVAFGNPRATPPDVHLGERVE